MNSQGHGIQGIDGTFIGHFRLLYVYPGKIHAPNAPFALAGAQTSVGPRIALPWATQASDPNRLRLCLRLHRRRPQTVSKISTVTVSGPGSTHGRRRPRAP